MDERAMQIIEILARPYTFILRPEPDGSWYGQIVEFPGCISAGDDWADAMDTLLDAAAVWLDQVIETGRPVPEPFPEGEPHWRPAPSDRLPSSTPPPAQRAAHGGPDDRKGSSLRRSSRRTAGTTLRCGASRARTTAPYGPKWGICARRWSGPRSPAVG